MAQTAQINIKVDGKQAEGSVNKLNQSLEQTETQTKSLRAELRQIQQELQGLEPGSQRFSELSQRAGQLRDTIQDTNAVITATAGNVGENLARGFSNMAMMGVQAFQGVLAGATLLGFESQNLQKTMVMLQATMALTQTIEFFAGLGDRITEVKAGFQGLLTTLGLVNKTQTATAASATATAAAETAQGVAATGAAGATGILATALNALPFMAIVTAIGLAIAALVTWISKSSEASEAEKKRKEELEKQKEATDSVVSSVAKEGSQLMMLLQQLRATNKGSKERKDLINTLNSQYGMTLKNLKDEKAFQDQVTVAVEEYITQLRNKVALQLVEQELTTLLTKQIGVRRALDDATQKNSTGTIILTKDIDGLNNQLENFSVAEGETLKSNRLNLIDYGKQRVATSQQVVKVSADEMKKLKDEDKVLTKQIEDLGKEGLKYTELLVGAYGKVDKATGGAGESQKDLNDETDKYRKILEGIKDELQREADATRQLIELNLDRDKISENVYTKRTKREQEIAKLEFDNIQFREKLIENAIDRELDALDEKFVKGGMSEQQYIDEVNRIREGGYENLLQSEKDLLDRKTDLMYEEITRREEAYEQMRVDAINNTQLTEIEIAQMTTKFNKDNAIRDVEMSAKSEKEKQEEILKIKEDYLTQEKFWLEKSQQERTDIIDEEEKKELKNFEGTTEEKDAIHMKYEKQRLEVTQETLEQIGVLEQESVGDLESKADKFTRKMTEASAAVSEYGGKFMETFGAVNELLSQQSENRISQFQDSLDTELHNIQQLYDSKMISEEEYNAQKLHLEEQTQEKIKSEKRKAFQREKAYNIANAIMQGAVAVLNGLSTQPLLPLGLIMAGVAGVTTGIQIATISQQQFKAARGGIVPGEGDGRIDSVPSMLAPGEAVINSKSTSMFPNTLSLINQAGGGIPLVPENIQQGSSGSGTIFTENQPQSIRAYVVETEITDTQRRVGRIERSVEF